MTLIRLSTLLFFFVFINLIHSQNWGLDGSEWFYSKPNAIGNPQNSYDKYYIEKDTIINSSLCKKATNNNKVYYLYENEKKVYYWFNNSFHLIYDYDVQIGDTIVFDFMSYKQNSDLENIDTTYAISCILISIDTSYIDGVNLYTWNYDIIMDPSLNHITWRSKYRYMNHIGYLPEFIYILPLPSQGHQTTLRCFNNSTFNYINPWWEQFDLSCDYQLLTNIEDPSVDDFFVNTIVSDHIIIKTEQELNQAEISLYDISGQLIMNNLISISYYSTVDVSHINVGAYFLLLRVNNKYLNFKLLKL